MLRGNERHEHGDLLGIRTHEECHAINKDYFHGTYGNSIKWNVYFRDEQELLRALENVDIETYIKGHFHGYEYIQGFQRYYNKNGFLTEKQMRQLERCAFPLWKYYRN